MKMNKRKSKSKSTFIYKTRKELRKQKRLDKKAKRAQHYCKALIADDTSNTQELQKSTKPLVVKSQNGNASEKCLALKKSENNQIKKLERQMKTQRIKQMKHANYEEDRIIKNLEKKLKLNKRKSKSLPKAFANEGLDYLLEICDSNNKESIGVEKEFNEAEIDFEKDLSLVTDEFANASTMGTKNKKYNLGNVIDDSADDIEHNASDGDYETSQEDEISDLGSDDFEEGEESLEEELSNTEESISDSADNSISDLGNTIDDSKEQKTKESKNGSKYPIGKENSEVSASSRLEKLRQFVNEQANDSMTNKNKQSNTAERMKKLENCIKCKTESECIENQSKNKANKKDRMKNLQNIVNKESKSNTVLLQKSERMKNLQRFIESESEPISEVVDDSGGVSRKRKNSSENEGGVGQKMTCWEDIYGRLRDKDGKIIENSVGKYVPPQLRAKELNITKEKSEQLERLRKQIKGMLNRLTENNIHSIATQFENLYMSNSRNDINDTLLRLITESLITPVLSPERITTEHAMLVAVLHANVGLEIGAHVLQHFVNEFNKLFDEDVAVEDKRLDNVLAFLAQMYNFKIFHACLLYGILEKLVQNFKEKDIELILQILKNVGFALRKDDPASLKELILNIQKKANESVILRENARVRFMLDTMLAIKNNNMTKIPQYDPTYIERLKKQLKVLVRQGKYVSELKISLDDLLNAETKGRWWIVGSAWSGDIKDSTKLENRNLVELSSFDTKLLELARKQRMNTDTRKNVFCILMSAEDYLDAFEKLIKLDLKGQQYQEIIHVIMHCLLKEKRYNPFYAFIAEQLCHDRKYQLAIQYSTWDKFKEINSFSTQQITNLAKFISYLIAEEKLTITVLKVLQFTEMTKQMVRLLRQILLSILLNKNVEVVANVFARAAKSAKLHTLREGLQLFLYHFILRNLGNDVDIDVQKSSILPSRVEIAVNSMNSSAMMS